MMMNIPIYSGSFASNGSSQLESTFSPAATTGKGKPELKALTTAGISTIIELYSIIVVIEKPVSNITDF
jgi:hypothetical protein